MAPRRIYLLLFVTNFLLICLPNISYGYDDKETHPNLTFQAIVNSKLDYHLIDNLALSEGIKTALSNKKIWEWLQEGSKLEDSPDCRAASHFLNPLKDWDKAGVSDTNKTLLGFLVVNPGCFVLAPFSDRYSIRKYSDITWATGFTSPSSELTDTDNDMDWNAARNYYRLALTASDNATREGNFAKTFQTLGQVMHLLQDMAVPAHVRNDFSAQRLLEELS